MNIYFEDTEELEIEKNTMISSAIEYLEEFLDFCVIKKIGNIMLEYSTGMNINVYCNDILLSKEYKLKNSDEKVLVEYNLELK